MTLLAPGASSAPTSSDVAGHLAKAGDATQAIVVTAENMSTSHGTLSTYEREGTGPWVRVMADMPARLGWNGLAKEGSRRQNSGETPAGTYALPWAFGRKANPGTSLRYVQVDRNDAWTYNPKVPSTYNVFQTVDRTWNSYEDYVEHLWSYGRQYDYVAVLDYNLPEGPITKGAAGVRRTSQPADTNAGGGIFLHVTDGGPTAGCIAVGHGEMRSILQWLDPAESPVIVIGTQ